MVHRRVCYPFVGDTVGGSHLSTVPVIRAIAARGYKPLVLLHEQGPLAAYFRGQGIAFEMAPPVGIVGAGAIPAQMLGMLRAAATLTPFLLRHGVSLVHTNDGRMHFTWGLATRLAGCAFVWHQRSADDSRRLGRYSRLANAVLTISEHCRAVFPDPMSRRAQVIRDPVSVPDAPAERDKACHALAADFGVSPATPVVGYVGNLTRQKRPLLFVDIAAALRDRLGADAIFPMFGEKRSGLADLVQDRIASAGLEGQCRLMGPRYPIEPWIAACDVLVAPATAEGLGRTLVEAMLAETPVVAADDAGHREAISDGYTGRLAPPDDPSAFADAVVSLLRDHVYRKAMCARAARFARETFSEDKHVRAIAAVYDRLLGAV